MTGDYPSVLCGRCRRKVPVTALGEPCPHTCRPTPIDPEARFLELAARHERLRRGCPCPCHHQSWRYGHPELYPCNGCWQPLCSGWLPLTEPERLGALVEVAATTVGQQVKLYPTCPYDAPRNNPPTGWGAELGNYHDDVPLSIGAGPTPWAALTEALFAAEVKS